jgi:HEAT repeat protein
LLGDHRSNRELMVSALRRGPDPDPGAYRLMVQALQERVDAFLLVELGDLCAHGGPAERTLAADVLSQSYIEEKQEIEECSRILMKLLKREVEPPVLACAGRALGQLHSPTAVIPLARLRRHPAASVRFAAVHGLLYQSSALAINTLIELSADPDRDVRNWATFGLGSVSKADSPRIREALLKRLDDVDGEIRGEAMLGLALRREVRLIGPLLKELEIFDADEVHLASLLEKAAAAARRAAIESRDEHWISLIRRLDELSLGQGREQSRRRRHGTWEIEIAPA